MTLRSPYNSSVIDWPDWAHKSTFIHAEVLFRMYFTSNCDFKPLNLLGILVFIDVIFSCFSAASMSQVSLWLYCGRFLGGSLLFIRVLTLLLFLMLSLIQCFIVGILTPWRGEGGGDLSIIPLLLSPLYCYCSWSSNINCIIQGRR